MKKITTLMIGFFFASFFAVAADKNFENALVTDRPDTAESSLTVGRHHFQMETSFGFATDEAAGVTTRTYSFPTLFRFGILENLELRMEGEMFAWQTTTGAATEKGFTDLAFGAKFHWLENEAWQPSLGFLAHVTLPTGKSAFSSNVAEPMFKVLADWALPLDFSLGTNIGIDVPVRDSNGDKYARFLYAASIGHSLPFAPERLRMFLELAGATPMKTDKSDEHTFDTGLTFLITPALQIDSFVQLGLSNAANDFTTGLGLSWKPL